MMKNPRLAGRPVNCYSRLTLELLPELKEKLEKSEYEEMLSPEFEQYLAEKLLEMFKWSKPMEEQRKVEGYKYSGQMIVFPYYYVERLFNSGLWLRQPKDCLDEPHRVLVMYKKSTEDNKIVDIMSLDGICSLSWDGDGMVGASPYNRLEISTMKTSRKMIELALKSTQES